MSNPQKIKGSAHERAVAQYLRERGYDKAQRRFGAGQQFDTGDVTGVKGVVIECKDQRKHELAVWADETLCEKLNARADIGVLVVKRLRKPITHAYAILSLEDLVTLLAEAGR